MVYEYTGLYKYTRVQKQAYFSLEMAHTFIFFTYTVEPRYLELAYFELPLISK